MSTDAPFTPPRKKPNVLWWLAGGFFVLLLWFSFQLFGPNPPIVVSRETTYITEPLGPNGLPDYEKHVLDLYRDGVTPENNAAVLLWQALWPGELDPKDYAAVAAELGLSEIPSSDDSLKHLHGNENQVAILAWLQTRGGTPVRDESEPASEQALDNPNSELVDKVIDEAMSRPWTSEQIPPLGEWIKANKQPFDLMLEASRRPRCYFPSPSLIDDNSESLIQMLLPGPQTVREAGRALSARAMWHLGEGRVDESWQDLLAVHRIGRLTAQGQTMVEQLVGIAIDGIATNGTMTLLDHGKLSVEQIRQVRRDLESLPEMMTMADSIDQMERLWFIDSIIRLSKGGNMQELTGTEEFKPFGLVSVDWNLVLREGNKWYDRLANAARLPTWTQREAAIAQVEGDLLQQEVEIKNPAQLAAGIISRRQRSRIMSSVTLALFLPAMNAATSAQDRNNAMLELARFAAALAEYRAEYDAYPEKLDDLVPSIYDQLPVDLFHAKPFLYKRDGDGYLLYSAGPNGQDDGGSNEMMSTLQGREVSDLPPDEQETESQKIPSGADDYSIRVPRPAFEMPPMPKQ